MEQTNTVIKEKKTLNKRQKDMIFVACLVVIPLIHYLIFYVYVNFNSILPLPILRMSINWLISCRIRSAFR